MSLLDIRLETIAQGFLLDFNQEDKDKALTWAVKIGSIRVVQLLLEAGAKANGDNGRPVFWADFDGRTEIKNILIESGKVSSK